MAYDDYERGRGGRDRGEDERDSYGGSGRGRGGFDAGRTGRWGGDYGDVQDRAMRGREDRGREDRDREERERWERGRRDRGYADRGQGGGGREREVNDRYEGYSGGGGYGRGMDQDRDWGRGRHFDRDDSFNRGSRFDREARERGRESSRGWEQERGRGAGHSGWDSSSFEGADYGRDYTEREDRGWVGGMREGTGRRDRPDERYARDIGRGPGGGFGDQGGQRGEWRGDRGEHRGEWGGREAMGRDRGDQYARGLHDDVRELDERYHGGRIREGQGIWDRELQRGAASDYGSQQRGGMQGRGREDFDRDRDRFDRERDERNRRGGSDWW